MHGVRGFCNLVFFLVLISGFILPLAFADQTMNITDPVVIPSLVNETFNQSENSSVISTTILLTTEPTVTETAESNETSLPVDTTTTLVPNETLTDTPATTEPTPEPTVNDTVRPEDTPPQIASATTTPVPVDTLTRTPITTEPTPEPSITPGNSRKETQIIPTNSPLKSLRAQARSPGKAPVNPAFISYQNRTKQSQIKQASVKESTTIVFNDGSTSRVFLEGEIPSPVDFSYTSGQLISMDGGSFSDGSVFPSSYDLRNYGRVSTVKNQGSAGVCWAFATIASLESYLLPGESLDLSENHMKNTLASTYTGRFRSNLG